VVAQGISNLGPGLGTVCSGGFKCLALAGHWPSWVLVLGVVMDSWCCDGREGAWCSGLDFQGRGTMPLGWVALLGSEVALLSTMGVSVIGLCKFSVLLPGWQQLLGSQG